jgi:hypothetical protein
MQSDEEMQATHFPSAVRQTWFIGQSARTEHWTQIDASTSQ